MTTTLDHQDDKIPIGVGGSSEALSSLPQAAFNYINSIVGSGVIGIPYALHKAGFGFGLLLLAFVAFITDYSLILMVMLRSIRPVNLRSFTIISPEMRFLRFQVRCGHICGRFSYPGIMEAAFGKWGYYFLSVLQFMYPFLGEWPQLPRERFTTTNSPCPFRLITSIVCPCSDDFVQRGCGRYAEQSNG